MLPILLIKRCLHRCFDRFLRPLIKPLFVKIPEGEHRHCFPWFCCIFIAFKWCISFQNILRTIHDGPPHMVELCWTEAGAERMIWLDPLGEEDEVRITLIL